MAPAEMPGTTMPKTARKIAAAEAPAHEASEALGGLGEDDASPGPLRSESWITLQTRQAQRLVSGRRAENGTPGIVGLTRFASMLRPLWTAARADDPWADWWLLAETQRLSEAPPLPFDLSGLQQECSRRFGMGAQETLDSAQRLYEQWKATTYPRTDCTYLPESQFADVPAVLAAVLASDTEAMAERVREADRQRRSRVWDDRKITAHHAIIPTAARAAVKEMSETDRRVYDLIRRRYVAQFYAAHEFDRTRIELHIEGELMHCTGRVPMTFPSCEPSGCRLLKREATDTAVQASEPLAEDMTCACVEQIAEHRLENDLVKDAPRTGMALCRAALDSRP